MINFSTPPGSSRVSPRPPGQARARRKGLAAQCADLARRMHQALGMRGVITNADVLKNPLLICRQFGVGALLRCLGAILRSSEVTFLELAVRVESGHSSHRGQVGTSRRESATSMASATLSARSPGRFW